MDNSHVNYARTGPGAARGITTLRGNVGAVVGNLTTVMFYGAGKQHTVQFYFDPAFDNWKPGQGVEITIASFDA